MTKLTRESLKELQAKKKEELSKAAPANDVIRIIVGLGSCGIAAGAKETEEAFKKEIQRKDLKNIEVKQTGCMGNCQVEPVVEVVMPGMPTVIYGKVTPELAEKIIAKHIIKKTILNNHLQDQQAEDIIG